MSINDALDNQDLDFTFPGNQIPLLSDMIVLGDEASDGEDALLLRQNCFGGSTVIAPRKTSTTIEGPAILQFYYRGHELGFIVDEVYLKHVWNNLTYETREGDWIRAIVIIPGDGTHTIQWEVQPARATSCAETMIDQVSISNEPLLFSDEQDQSTVVGPDRLLKYQALTLEESTHQLLAGDEVVLESVNEPLNLQTLNPEDSGSCRIKIIDTFGDTISDPVEITIYDTIGQAVEQPDLQWQYEGDQLWIPQIYETYDGQDAAATLDQSNEYGAVFILVRVKFCGLQRTEI